MWLLILDSLRRRRFLFGMYVFIMVVDSIHGRSMAAALPVPFLAILISRELLPGWLLVVRPLPIASRELALARWFNLFGLAPLIGFAMIPVGVFIGSLLQLPNRVVDSWFSPAFGVWMALGFFAFLDVLRVVLKRTAKRLAQLLDTVSQGFGSGGRVVLVMSLFLVMLCFIVGIMAAMVALMLVLGGVGNWVPTNFGGMRPFHWFICATVPVWVVWSLINALVNPSFIARGMPVGAAKRAMLSEPTKVKQLRPGKNGLRMLLGKIHFQFWILLGVYIIMGTCAAWWLSKLSLSADIAEMVPAFVQGTEIFAGTFVCAVSPLWWNFRVVRSLPISTRGLASIMIGMPFYVGLVVALYSVSGLLGKFTLLPHEVFTTGWATAAIGAVALAMGLWFPLQQLVLTIAVCAALTVGHVACVNFGPAWLGAAMPWFELALIPFSYRMVVKGLRQSSVVYSTVNARALSGSA